MVNVQHSLMDVTNSNAAWSTEGTKTEEPLTDTEMGLGGLVGHMSAYEISGLFYQLEELPPSPSGFCSGQLSPRHPKLQTVDPCLRSDIVGDTGLISPSRPFTMCAFYTVGMK